MYSPVRRAEQSTGQEASYVKRGVALIGTLDALLAEGDRHPHTHSQTQTQQTHNGTRRIRRLHLRTDLAEHITRTLCGLEELAKQQQNAKAQHTAENILQRLQQVTFLRIYAPPSSTELHYFKLGYYLALEELLLEDCPLSLAVDIYALRRCLFKIRCVQCGVTSLSAALSPVKKALRHSLSTMVLSDTTLCSLPGKVLWSQCTSLSLVNCGLSRIDEALHFFPHLTYLNLSHNAITQVVHLHDCIALQTLDLSHNKIRVLSNLERVLGKIRIFLLSHNEIESLDGIDKIYSLETLDLSANAITDVHEMANLARLPCLEAIFIAQNQLCEKKNYRLHIYREFLRVGSIMSGNRSFPSLDGREIHKRELQKLRRLLFRAPTDSMVESSYGSHLMDLDEEDTLYDEDDDAFTLEDGYSADVMDMPRPLSRLSLGTVSPLSADAFRRLSTARTHSSAGNNNNNGPFSFSPHAPHHGASTQPHTHTHAHAKMRTASTATALMNSPVRPRRTSVERTRSSDVSFFHGRESVSSAMYGSAHNTHRQSQVLKKMLAKRVSSSASSSFSTPPSPASVPQTHTQTHTQTQTQTQTQTHVVRKRRVAHIASGEHTQAPLSLAEIEEDLRTHPERWRVRDRRPSLSLSHTDGHAPTAETEKEKEKESANLSVSLSSATTTATMTNNISSPRRDATIPKTTSSFSSSSLPAQDEPVTLSSGKGETSPPPSMDAFIGRIHDDTEFRSFTNGNSNASNNNNNNNRNNAANDTGKPPLSSPTRSAIKTKEQERGKESSSGETAAPPRLSEHTAPPMHTHTHTHMFTHSTSSERDRERLMLEVDPYVGEAQYRTLSVLQNLELYFRQQVFPSHRPSFPALYLREQPNAQATTKHDHALHLITPFAPEERFITLFVERVIDLKDASLSSHTQSQRRTSSTTTASRKEKERSEKDEEQDLAREQWSALVLSDLALYIVDISQLSPTLRFADSPLLQVVKYHPLYKLSLCTIYFGFQRCALGFYDDPYHTEKRSVEDMSACYMVLTRDKARTYPIITRIPQVANQQRNSRRPRALPNVRIENKDSQLLEALTQSMGTLADNDITHYQMVFQSRPCRAARSILLTPRRLLFCHEDLCRLDVVLTVLDSASLSELRQVVSQDKDVESGLYGVKLIIKKSGVLSAQRKWRIACETQAMRDKLLEECRRALQEAS